MKTHNEWKPCEICGKTAQQRHHVFFGSANRKQSEYWGMVANLCYDCHALVHADYAARVELCKRYQLIFESQYGHELFVAEFGRSYL